MRCEIVTINTLDCVRILILSLRSLECIISKQCFLRTKTSFESLYRPIVLNHFHMWKHPFWFYCSAFFLYHFFYVAVQIKECKKLACFISVAMRPGNTVARVNKRQIGNEQVAVSPTSEVI